MADTDKFTIDSVLKKVQALDIDYIERNIGSDPAVLPQHVAEYNGYASILYDHYASVLRQYRLRQAVVTKEEDALRKEHNEKNKDKRGAQMTVTEMSQRIEVRLSDIRSKRDSLEIAVKGVTLHLNVCQSLMKNWGDEAKGIR